MQSPHFSRDIYTYLSKVNFALKESSYNSWIKVQNNLSTSSCILKTYKDKADWHAHFCSDRSNANVIFLIHKSFLYRQKYLKKCLKYGSILFVFGFRASCVCFADYLAINIKTALNSSGTVCGPNWFCRKMFIETYTHMKVAGSWQKNS